MSTLKHSPEDVEMYKAAIGELLELAKKPNVKKVIGAYSYFVKYQANFKKIKAFSVAELEDCAVFLKLKVRNDDDTKIFKNKDILADRIILKIESHFAEQCDECDKKYQSKLDGETPYLPCYLCIQGSHDCEAVSARFERLSQDPTTHLTGSVWLCKGCRLKNKLSGSTNLQRRTVSFEEEEKEEEKSSETKDDNVNDFVVVKKTETDKDTENVSRTPGEDRPSPRRDTHEERSEEKSQEQIICPLYKKHQCPYGASGQTEVQGKTCEHAHPRRCVKFCRFGKRRGGCIKGNSCKLYHPVLCKFSLKSGKCLNPDCTYTHLVGTKRQHFDEDRDKDTRQYNTQRFRPTAGTSRMDTRPPRLRRDSTTSVESHSSEAFRTPFTRKRINSDQQRSTAPNDFLEKLMENMKQGFSQQRAEIGNMKQGIDTQIEAFWKQLSSINQTSLPQLPTFHQYQLPSQMVQPPTVPWNNGQNQCSIY